VSDGEKQTQNQVEVEHHLGNMFQKGVSLDERA